MDNVNKESIQYKWLDLIRGLAALAVFIGHLRVLCILDTPVSDLDVIGKMLFFLTGFGHIAVVIFFVLSGFLIIKSIDSSNEKNSFSSSSYAKNRIMRLWVVLIPCLILGLVFDKIGLKYYGDSLLYSNEWKYLFHQDLITKLSIEIFFGNLFFLQTILVPTLGTNAALWTLANEFWYYAIFPFLYFSFCKKINLKLRLLFLGIGIALLLFVGLQISLNFLIWLAGGLSYIITKFVSKKILQNNILRYIVASLFIIFMVLLRSKYQPVIFNNYTVALIFSLLVPLLVNTNIKNKMVTSIATYLSNISYTLYLAHLPFMNLITAIFNFQGKPWSLNNGFVYVLFVISVILYATLLWFIFERNTAKFKQLLFTKNKTK